MMGRTAAGLGDQRPLIDAPGEQPPWRAWLLLAAWLLAFAMTRWLPAAVTFDPTLYGPEISDPTGDLRLYGGWGDRIVGEGLAPYREIDIEYPPGSLPFVIVPALLAGGGFSPTIFVVLLGVVDVAALGALLLLARRTGSYRGAAVWLLLPPLLGVLLYARLDVIPAVATLLALERGHARRWFASGVWFGLGAAAKLFPALLIPLALLAAAGRRARLLAGVALGAAAAWLPFVGDTGEMLGDVLGYHSARGIHLESLWGSLLNLQRIAGGPVDLVFEYGAFHITGPSAPAMLRWTTWISLGVVAVCVLIAVVRWLRHPALAHAELPLAATTMLALLLGTGRVFSPQFLLWLLAAAAVLCAVLPRVALWAAPLLAVIVVLTAAGYPLGFDLLRDGERWPALVLVYRNGAVIAFGLLLLLRWLQGGTAPMAPAGAEPDTEGG
jgi:hypothetical protein